MLIPIILSGGAGARLWPASREGYPKPFLKMADGETLLAKTYRRAGALANRVVTVTNRDYYFMSRDEIERAGNQGGFLLEPCARNTGPAIALAAHYAQSVYGRDATLLVLPADHLIQDQAAFEAAAGKAIQLADQGYLVTFGVVPHRPETGFGYIEPGEAILAGNKVKRFVEKPDLATATGYVSSGKYVWNSGMFCFRADVLLDELSSHAPELWHAVNRCWQAMQPLTNPAFAEIPLEHFKDVPAISIDFALMEKSDKVAVVPGSFGWSDIGSWTAVRELVPADAQQNRASGEAVFVKSSNTFIQSDERLVAAVGVDDVIIVDTADALLVVHQERVQDVKEVFERLKQGGNDLYRLHRTVVRPWGTYTVLQHGPGYKIKRIEVRPGASLSLQMHRRRSEHWVVVSGTARITNGEKELEIRPNESAYIPAGQKHRLSNPGTLTCVMIEVQCGAYLEEDDIVRFDDIYGRS